MFTDLATWLHHTALSVAPGTGAVAAVLRNLHFAGLALLLGVAGMFDLRLMGVMKKVPIAIVATSCRGRWASINLPRADLRDFRAHAVNSQSDVVVKVAFLVAAA